MKAIFAISGLFLMAACAGTQDLVVADVAAPGDASILPAWHGVWRGGLQNLPPREGAPTIDVELKVAVGDDDDDGCLVHRMTYSEAGAVKQVKDYALCRRADGRYVVDEGGGVVLNASVYDNVLYSAFRARNVLLVSREAVNADVFTQEIFFADIDAPSEDSIQSFEGDGLQKLVLRRVDETP